MHCWLLFANVFLFGVAVVRARNSAYYEVVGVACEPNEVVSCLRFKCPAGRYCPAERFCYNPKCVCRQGYHRIRGFCVQKHVTHDMDRKALESALLQTQFRDEFGS